MSTLRPFCWIGLISCMNWVRITWFLVFWFARRVVESSPFSYLSITQFPISLSDSSSFSCVFFIWLCFGLSCLIWMPIFSRKFCPVMWAFQSSTMMNGPNWVVHPPDSNAMIRRLFGTTFFPFLQARFRAASADGSSLNTAEFCFGVVFLPFFSLRNYIAVLLLSIIAVIRFAAQAQHFGTEFFFSSQIFVYHAIKRSSWHQLQSHLYCNFDILSIELSPHVWYNFCSNSSANARETQSVSISSWVGYSSKAWGRKCSIAPIFWVWHIQEWKPYNIWISKLNGWLQ